MEQQKESLNPLPEDNRDALAGLILALPPLSEVPDNYEVNPFGIVETQGDDNCTGASTTRMAGVHNKVRHFYPWVFAKAKEGNADSWGANLRQIAKAWQKYGCPAWEDMPENIIKKYEEKDWDFLRRIENYPDLYEKAKKNRMKSYMFIKDTYDRDAFDLIRSLLWKYRKEEKTVVIGLLWAWGLSDYKLNLREGGSGHAIWQRGFKEKNWGLLTNSYGAGAGKNGDHLISREVINKYIPRYGAIIFTDMPAEEAKKQQERAFWIHATPLQRLKKLIGEFNIFRTWKIKLK